VGTGERETEPASITYIRVAGEVAALGALLLPGTGFVLRWMAFALDPGIEPAFRIALAAPVGVLTATGLAALSLTVWGLPFAIFFVFLERRHVKEGKHHTPEWMTRRHIVIPVVIATVLLILDFAMSLPLYSGGFFVALSGGLSVITSREWGSGETCP